jgi:hypothetical protein
MDAGAIAYGIGTLLISWLLPHLFKIIPRPLQWSGFVFGGLLVLWGAMQNKTSIPVAPALLFIFGAACIVGSVAWYFESRASDANVSAKKEIQSGQVVVAIGGDGGGAKVFGSGIAVGGPGGSIADGAQGRGGAGGNAEVYGNGIAAGGAGGSVGSDSYWPHPAKNGYDAMMVAKGVSAPADYRWPGRGGAVAGYEEKLAIVKGLRARYFAEEHTPPKDYLDDINAVPLDYLNNAIEASGVRWRVKIVDLNEYDFYIL